MPGARSGLLVATACAVCVAMSQPRAAAQEPALADVLRNAAHYVDEFEQRLTAVVAEETYEQRTNGVRRTLKSDLLLIPVSGEARFLGFRDVYEVDGSAVRDRGDRLAHLFLDGSTPDAERLREIVTESARYNLGSVPRTLNIPTLPLVFLREENQRGGTFKAGRGGPVLSRLNDISAPELPSLPQGTAVVAFTENGRNTLVRDARNRDVPSRGRFWIEPATGRVLATEFIADAGQSTATIVVRYQPEPGTGLLVPAEMRERYTTFAKSSIEGRATYDHFKTFQVQTSTDIERPK
jgi:hypothetical protein